MPAGTGRRSHHRVRWAYVRGGGVGQRAGVGWAVAGLAGIGPQGEAEGMIAAQLPRRDVAGSTKG